MKAPEQSGTTASAWQKSAAKRPVMRKANRDKDNKHNTSVSKTNDPFSVLPPPQWVFQSPLIEKGHTLLPPVVDADHHTVVLVGSTGRITALDTETGLLRWEVHLQTPIEAPALFIAASSPLAPAPDTSAWWVATRAGTLIGLSATTGERLFERTLPGPITAGGSLSPDGQLALFLSRRGHLIAVGKAQPAKLLAAVAEISTPQSVSPQPSVSRQPEVQQAAPPAETPSQVMEKTTPTSPSDTSATVTVPSPTTQPPALTATASLPPPIAPEVLWQKATQRLFLQPAQWIQTPEGHHAITTSFDGTLEGWAIPSTPAAGPPAPLAPRWSLRLGSPIQTPILCLPTAWQTTPNNLASGVALTSDGNLFALDLSMMPATDPQSPQPMAFTMTQRWVNATHTKALHPFSPFLVPHQDFPSQLSSYGQAVAQKKQTHAPPAKEHPLTLADWDVCALGSNGFGSCMPLATGHPTHSLRFGTGGYWQTLTTVSPETNYSAMPDVQLFASSPDGTLHHHSLPPAHMTTHAYWATPTGRPLSHITLTPKTPTQTSKLFILSLDGQLSCYQPLVEYPDPR